MDINITHHISITLTNEDNGEFSGKLSAYNSVGRKYFSGGKTVITVFLMCRMLACQTLVVYMTRSHIIIPMPEKRFP